MADTKISALPTMSALAGSELVTGVQSAANKNATPDLLATYVQTGWAAAGETWTFATASTFTVSGDVTGKYAVGDRLKLTQTTTKFFYIVGLSFSAGTTTITVTGGSDYSLANAAITSPFFSKFAEPPGFPFWFNWSPTLTGFGTNPTTAVYQFCIVGRICTLAIRQQGTGSVSNANTFAISLPVTAATVSGHFWTGTGLPFDNSLAVSTTAALLIASAGTTLTASKDATGANNWTTSGQKALSAATISYAI